MLTNYCINWHVASTSIDSCSRKPSLKFYAKPKSFRHKFYAVLCRFKFDMVGQVHIWAYVGGHAGSLRYIPINMLWLDVY